MHDKDRSLQLFAPPVRCTRVALPTVALERFTALSPPAWFWLLLAAFLALRQPLLALLAGAG